MKNLISKYKHNNKKNLYGSEFMLRRQTSKTVDKEVTFLSDIHRNNRLCLHENNPEIIHILIGVYVEAKLFTGNVK